MSLKSVYLPAPSIQDNRILIAGDEHRHLVVARVEPDELIEIFDGNGHAWTAAVESVNKRETIARVTASREATPPLRKDSRPGADPDCRIRICAGKGR